MHNIMAAHAPDSLRALAQRFLGPNIQTVARSSRNTKELTSPITICLENPAQNLPLLAGRQGNPWTWLCEFPWFMAGRADIAYLLPYLPRAGDFSDDGQVWRAGYGPRLRGKQEVTREPYASFLPAVDQLAVLAARLRKDPLTRQAVFTIWRPEEDVEAVSRDIPCTVGGQFLLRNGALDLQIFMRSNDMFWGYGGVNVVNFTQLLRLFAELMDVPPGRYYHTAGSMHVYEEHWQRLPVLAGSRSAQDLYRLGPDTLNFFYGDDPSDLELFTERCHQAIKLVQSHQRPDGQALGPWLTEWVRFMNLYPEIDGAGSVMWLHTLATRLPRDWSFAAMEYINRRNPNPVLFEQVFKAWKLPVHPLLAQPPVSLPAPASTEATGAPARP